MTTTHDESLRARRMKGMREYRKAQMTRRLMTEQEIRDNDDLSARIDSIRRQNDDDRQAQFLTDHGDCQDRSEKAFLYGLLTGGAFGWAALLASLYFFGALK